MEQLTEIKAGNYSQVYNSSGYFAFVNKVRNHIGPANYEKYELFLRLTLQKYHCYSNFPQNLIAEIQKEISSVRPLLIPNEGVEVKNLTKDLGATAEVACKLEDCYNHCQALLKQYNEI